MLKVIQQESDSDKICTTSPFTNYELIVIDTDKWYISIDKLCKQGGFERIWKVTPNTKSRKYSFPAVGTVDASFKCITILDCYDELISMLRENNITKIYKVNQFKPIILYKFAIIQGE